jgi:hypothetical protein
MFAGNSKEQHAHWHQVQYFFRVGKVESLDFVWFLEDLEPVAIKPAKIDRESALVDPCCHLGWKPEKIDTCVFQDGVIIENVIHLETMVHAAVMIMPHVNIRFLRCVVELAKFDQKVMRRDFQDHTLIHSVKIGRQAVQCLLAAINNLKIKHFAEQFFRLFQIAYS